MGSLFVGSILNDIISFFRTREKPHVRSVSNRKWNRNPVWCIWFLHFSTREICEQDRQISLAGMWTFHLRMLLNFTKLALHICMLKVHTCLINNSHYWHTEHSTLLNILLNALNINKHRCLKLLNSRSLHKFVSRLILVSETHPRRPQTDRPLLLELGLPEAALEKRLADCKKLGHLALN